MRRSNTQPLKEVIQEYVKALKMSSKLKEVSLIGSWERVVGTTISRATRDIYISNRVLYVTLNSSVIRNELHLMQDILIKRLNEEANSDVIDSVSLK